MESKDKKDIIKFINGEKFKYSEKLESLYEKVKDIKTDDPYIRYIQEYFGDKPVNKNEFMKYKKQILGTQK